MQIIQALQRNSRQIPTAAVLENHTDHTGSSDGNAQKQAKHFQAIRDSNSPLSIPSPPPSLYVPLKDSLCSIWYLAIFVPIANVIASK